MPNDGWRDEFFVKKSGYKSFDLIPTFVGEGANFVGFGEVGVGVANNV